MRSFRSAPQPPSDTAPDKVVRLFQSETAEILESPEPAGIRGTTYVAAALIVALVVLAAMTRLDRVIESVGGEIVSTTPTEVLQSLDSALIKTINVRVGDRVKAGDVLATLDPTFASADVGALQLQIANYDSQITRAEAELAGQAYTPPPAADVAAARYGEMQTALFAQRKSQYDEQMRAYNSQISQYKATLAKLKNNETRYADRMALAKEVEQMRATLAAAQVGSRLHLLTAMDQKTELLRNLEFVHNSLEETQHQLQAAIATRDAFAQKWLADASQELVTARNQRDTARQQLEKALRKKDLVRLAASEDSVVLRMAKLSVGSVLKDAEPLMYLAPLNSPVEAEIRIAPRDIGFIRPGDPVKIKLDAFDFVEHGMVKGTISWISEGAFMIDERTGQPTSEPYYKARITLTDTSLRNVPDGFRLIPGMTLAADVHIGTRSILTYLVSGAVRTFSEAMREP
ncbi:MAG: HlyD family type I secretion periplasmic adaptor subunit [Alphaproteobacteria bacterium]